MDGSTEILSYFLSSLVTEGMWIVLVCLFIGYVIKHQFSFIKNDYIPLITAIVGGILAVIIPGMFPKDEIAMSIIKGIALGWASTGMYETVRNLVLSNINKVSDTIAEASESDDNTSEEEKDV